VQYAAALEVRHIINIKERWREKAIGICPPWDSGNPFHFVEFGPRSETNLTQLLLQ
jgi:hypothetical protein